MKVRGDKVEVEYRLLWSKFGEVKHRRKEFRNVKNVFADPPIDILNEIEGRMK